MAKKINILSIDWDYFINATNRERSKNFPDGGTEDMPEAIKDVIWATLYAKADITQIKTEKSSISEIIDVLEAQTHGHTKVMIADSHKHIFDFIEENNKDKKAALNLVNVDYHHDLFSSNGEAIHCGNWLLHTINTYPETSTYTWIARKDSEVDEKAKKNIKLEIVNEDLRKLWDYKWDYVFICRSSMWSPPHLDEEFNEAFEWILSEFQVKYESGIFNSRYSEDFKQSVASFKERIAAYIK